jgi:hypothetical protein
MKDNFKIKQTLNHKVIFDLRGPMCSQIPIIPYLRRISKINCICARWHRNRSVEFPHEHGLIWQNDRRITEFQST